MFIRNVKICMYIKIKHRAKLLHILMQLRYASLRLHEPILNLVNDARLHLKCSAQFK